jgi:predicted TIM-barrel fold metal-dependent hydrolase
MHIGSSSALVITSEDAPIDVLISLTPINIVQAAADLIWSPVFRKFPNIKVALSEGGIGWIPYFLERIDYQFEQHHRWTGQDFGGRLPSEVFNEHVITCFIDDQFGLASREFLNMDNVTWECDYPHSDSTWPQAPEVLWKSLQTLPDDEIVKVSHRNAMKHFNYDPFAHVPEAEATVGALRRKAHGHDVSIKSQIRAERSRSAGAAALATGLRDQS